MNCVDGLVIILAGVTLLISIYHSTAMYLSGLVIVLIVVLINVCVCVCKEAKVVLQKLANFTHSTFY